MSLAKIFKCLFYDWSCLSSAVISKQSWTKKRIFAYKIQVCWKTHGQYLSVNGASVDAFNAGEKERQTLQNVTFEDENKFLPLPNGTTSFAWKKKGGNLRRGGDCGDIKKKADNLCIAFLYIDLRRKFLKQPT